MAAPVAADIPSKYDVIIDGQGYLFTIQDQQRIAFNYSAVRASFEQSATYVPRTNTEGYGDDKQDFWFTWTQKDWSGGEGEKYQARGSNPQNSFWRGKNVEISSAGEVKINYGKTDLTFATNVKSGCGATTFSYIGTTTTLYHIDNAGTITSDGAHGLGAAPSRWGMCIGGGGTDIYISTTGAGTVGIRRWNGAIFQTWSATPADSLASLNNTLYGYKENTGDLMRYDTGGIATSQYTWQNDEGVALTGIKCKLVPFGGKMIILRSRASGNNSCAELWLYDGTAAPSKIAEFAPNLEVYDCVTFNGAVFISGSYIMPGGSYRPVIIFYKDGTQGELWKAEKDQSVGQYPPLAVYQNGILFGEALDVDGGLPRLVYYNSDTGSFSSVLQVTGVIDTYPLLIASNSFVVVVPNSTSGTTGFLWPSSTGATVSEIDSSVIDFDSSLKKIVRGIRIFFNSGGGSSTVDLSYSLDEGAWVSLQTGVVSGVEYPLTTPAEGTTYHSIKVRVTLNRGSGDITLLRLKRLLVRAIPVQPVYRLRTYNIQLIGKDGKGEATLKNGEPNPLDGKEMLTNLQASAAKTSPFSIIDYLGSFTGVIQEWTAIVVRTEEWAARVTVREV